MAGYNSCSKCGAPTRRSRKRSFGEYLMAPLLLPYRCTVCDKRELKLRFGEALAGLEEEQEEEAEVVDVGEVSLEQIPSDLLEAEAAAKKALSDAELQVLELKAQLEEARKRVDDKRREMAAEAAAEKAAQREAELAKKKAEAAERREKARKEAELKEQRPPVGPDGRPRVRKKKRPRPPEYPVNPQSHTLDEEEEQIWPS